MNEIEKLKFINSEIEAIYEDFDTKINQLVLLRHFFKDLLAVTKGAEPSYQLSEIKKENNIKK